MSYCFWAHVAEDGRKQTVSEHLKGTADLCSSFASKFGARDQGNLIGSAHDIGKCSQEFQNRLNGGKIVDHSSAGALECAKQDALWASGCVAGHHGGLPDFGNINNDTSDDPTLFGRLRKAISGRIPAYMIPEDLPVTVAPQGFGKNALADSYTIRMLFSCLVDADYLDTERFMLNGPRHDDHDDIPELLKKMERYISPWWSPNNELNRRRCEVLRSCINRAADQRGLYTLTVPTGGGKTIASLAFALYHCIHNNMDRVIYVIPYTSIIEQTAAIFRSIFGEKNVIEHHSNVTYEINDNDDVSAYSRIPATENWDAPIIVTTSVQFFESLYSNRPSKCRKLHNISNSVIIFDEAQMIPTEHLRPCVAAVSSLLSQFRCTALLCTATQPLLNDLFAEYMPDAEIKEICPDVATLFRELRRVKYENAGKLDIYELAARLSGLSQVLCIVNSRKSAQTLFASLKSDDCFHLSTLMYPAHRREVLSEIRERLSQGLPCRVISTSLIEAGVDIDFPCVYRELAGLDSILQAGGRCNREGKRSADDSKVVIFEGLSVAPHLMKVNIGAAKEILDYGSELALPETIERYFKAYRSLAGERLDKFDIVSAFENGFQGRMLPFKTVAEKFRFIDDNTRTVYVPFGKAEALAERFRSGERSKSLFRALGHYGINIYEDQYQILIDSGALDLIDDEIAFLRDQDMYDPKTGLMIGDNKSGGLFI